jgi:hypothetical protein
MDLGEQSGERVKDLNWNSIFIQSSQGLLQGGCWEGKQKRPHQVLSVIKWQMNGESDKITLSALTLVHMKNGRLFFAACEQHPLLTPVPCITIFL